MKIIKVSVGKEYKFGLPSFSNITASAHIEAEIEKGEKVDWPALWDEINQQLHIQASGIEPGWIQTKQYKNFFKTTIKVEKNGGEKNG